MSKIILVDSTEITTSRSVSATSFEIALESKDEYATLLPKITNENVATLNVAEDDGTVFGHYENLTLQSFTLQYDEDTEAYSAVLICREADTKEQRIAELESELTQAQVALTELYETVLV